MASSISYLQRLLHDVLRHDEWHGLEILVQTLATAAGASGAILWTRARDEAAAGPSIVARWSDNGRAVPDPHPPDHATVAAFHTRTLILPKRIGDASDAGSAAVLAVLPVDNVDGGDGVLTLFGDGELTTDAFDVVVDLLDVLPELCRIVRERQGLALVRRCNDILHDADVEAAKRPLSPERLSHYLGQVCAVVAEALGCQQVSIYLQDPAAAEETFPLVATSAENPPVGSSVVRGVGPVGETIEYGTPVTECPGVSAGASGGRRTGSPALMAAPVMSGEQVSGAIVCTGTAGPRLHFTGPDLALLTPVTPQIARYWNTWLQRRTSFEENESWRLLAAGVTSFNQLLSEQLGRRNPNDGRVYEAAVDIVAKVVPGCVGGALWRPKDTGSGEPPLVLTGPPGLAASPTTAPPMTELVFRSRQQWSTTDPEEISGAGIDPAARWLVNTPLWVSHRRYGVLDVFGDSPTLPLNSPQVCRIIGDQLGLYLHLRQTLHKLQEARTTLSRTIMSQAEALEDLQHQLVSPLLAATSRTERVLQGRHFDGRTELQLRAVRGLCRKSSRVAMSAGVFAALSKGKMIRPKLELLYVDDLLRLLIAGADDAQLLSNPRRHIEFTVDRETVRALERRFIEADRTFLEQCVSNLLDNAAKYSYENTTVDIGGRVEDGSFALAVTNVGLTLDKGEVEHCLQRNWRGAAARSATGEGSGLGLWIVDHLMRSMNGRVSIQPAEDGTTALLTFPLR